MDEKVQFGKRHVVALEQAAEGRARLGGDVSEFVHPEVQRLFDSKRCS